MSGFFYVYFQKNFSLYVIPRLNIFQIHHMKMTYSIVVRPIGMGPVFIVVRLSPNLASEVGG